MKYLVVVFSLCLLFGCSNEPNNQQKLSTSVNDLDKKIHSKEDSIRSLKQEIELLKSNRLENETITNSKRNIKNSDQELKPIVPFYIINTKAVKTEVDAISETEILKSKGYDAAYLWIPNYESLSGAEYYSVYVGPFSTQSECQIALEEYHEIDNRAYGLLVSNESERVMIRGKDRVVSSNSSPEPLTSYKQDTRASEPSKRTDFPNGRKKKNEETENTHPIVRTNFPLIESVDKVSCVWCNVDVKLLEVFKNNNGDIYKLKDDESDMNALENYFELLSDDDPKAEAESYWYSIIHSGHFYCSRRCANKQQ